MAKAFVEVKDHLSNKLGLKQADWKYGNLHVNEYPNAPWSMTPLRKIWHREVSIGGNSNTPSVSKYNMARIEENKIIKSTHTANYKQIIAFNSDPKKEVNLMSIDTGMAGNVFSGKYFTMNMGHLHGELHRVSTDFSELEDKPSSFILNIVPKSQNTSSSKEDL